MPGGRSLKILPAATGPQPIGALVRLYDAGEPGKAGALRATAELQTNYELLSQGPREILFRLPDGGPYDLSLTYPDGTVVGERGVGPGVTNLRCSCSVMSTNPGREAALAEETRTDPAEYREVFSGGPQIVNVSDGAKRKQALRSCASTSTESWWLPCPISPTGISRWKAVSAGSVLSFARIVHASP